MLPIGWFCCFQAAFSCSGRYSNILSGVLVLVCIFSHTILHAHTDGFEGFLNASFNGKWSCAYDHLIPRYRWSYGDTEKQAQASAARSASLTFMNPERTILAGRKKYEFDSVDWHPRSCHCHRTISSWFFDLSDDQIHLLDKCSHSDSCTLTASELASLDEAKADECYQRRAAEWMPGSSE